MYSFLSDTAVATLVLALIGKVGASSGFHLAYQYSAEIFPTVVRNAGIGSSSCMARVGGIIAPFVADLVCVTYEPEHEKTEMIFTVKHLHIYLAGISTRRNWR